MPVISKHITQVDLSLKLYGTVEGLFDTALLNNASVTDDLIPGAVWEKVATQYDIKPVIIQLPVAPANEIVLKKQQSLADYTTQHGGTVNQLFDMAALNGLSITDEVEPGSVLKINGEDFKVIAYYKKSGHDIVSEKKVSELVPGGIGYMQIGNDFKVS
ncbi:MAG TPA: hypothetical protein VK173_07805 [Lacibacter sp.]|nr:hypothetical protein [Lacibacter sp.]